MMNDAAVDFDANPHEGARHASDGQGLCRDFPAKEFATAGLFFVLVLVLLLLPSLVGPQAAMPSTAGPNTEDTHLPAAAFVGRERCAVCHPREQEAWRGSHHDLAMQEATDNTVLGDFNDASFTHFGVTSRFFRREGGFFVTTEGPDGKLQDYEIRYTFGITPLQQYLIAFPDGRMQALSIAWDSRPREAGGGRWFHLYPHERIPPQDELHWTRGSQNWNWMCAECHATNLKRHYDAATDRYRTTWSEIDVSCEACHGPGSNHLVWAERLAGNQPVAPALAETKGLAIALDERRGVSWSQDANGQPVRTPPLKSRREIEICAQCHSRRAGLADGLSHGGPLMATHDPLVLLQGAYFADGQQQDEVYNYGSFLQSRMYAQGVTCSDCHDPHSGRTHAPGNSLCAQCHAPARFDQPGHTLHPLGTAGAQCVACHMPTRTYMVIDPRHDHALRVPRPDIAQHVGAPDPCTGCHLDRDAAWAAERIAAAFGPERKGYQPFATALQAARRGEPGAASLLTRLIQDSQAPAIARATAVRELEAYLSPSSLPLISLALKDADPLVRGAALETLLALPPQQRPALAMPLLDDPLHMVRLKAARALAPVGVEGLSAAQQAKLDQAFQDYVSSQEANAERPEAHLNLGLFHLDRRQYQDAEVAYRAALKLDATFAPAYGNLADLYRATGRGPEAEAVLLQGLRVRPDDGALSHALGLLRVRQKRPAEALRYLERAVTLSPDNARYAYVLAVALHDTGKPKEARAALERALVVFPYDRDLLMAALAYAREARDEEAASDFANRLAALTRGSQP